MKYIITVLLLTFGLIGQEIGIPFVDYSKINNSEFIGHKKVEISESTNSLIKLERDGKFTVWNLKPFSKKDEFTIPNASWFYSIDTSSKLAISTIKKINYQYVGETVIFDLTNKNILKKLSYATYGLTASNNKIYALEKNNTLHVYDKNSLNELNKIELNITKTLKRTFSGAGQEIEDTPFSININQNKLILNFSSNLIILDEENLTTLKKNIFNDSYQSTIFYLDTQQNVYFRGRKEELYMLDLKSLNLIKLENSHYIPNTGKILNLLLKNDLYNLANIKDNKQNIFAYGDNKIILITNTNSFTEYVKFSEFIKNEWIIITPEGYFDCSNNARKYLYIKSESGDTIPIDDNSFNRFHKQINIGE